MIYLKQFLQSKRSEKTKDHYSRILTAYESWCLNSGKGTMVSDTVLQYRDALVSMKQSDATINNKMACLTSYFGFLEALDVQPIVRLKGRIPRAIGGSSKETNGLTDLEVQSIVGSIDLSSDSGILHSALIHVMLYTGLRVSEVSSLKLSDLNQSGKIKTLTVYGKGGKYRTIPLHKNVVERLDAYLKIRIPQSEASRVYTDSTGGVPSRDLYRPDVEPLFTATENNRLEKLHNNSIRWIVKKYCEASGITKKISPHSFRVTCISNSLENGASPLYAQYLGGWTSMEMVLKYDRRRQELKNSAAFMVNYGAKK